MPSKGASDALRAYYRPEPIPDFRGGANAIASDPQATMWIRDYLRNTHARFLAANPGMCASLFAQAGTGVIQTIGDMAAFDPADKITPFSPYHYYEYFTRKAPPPEFAISYLINRMLCLPVVALRAISPVLPLLLPLLGAIAATILALAMRRFAWEWLLYCALAYFFYAIYAQSIFFECYEDSRHAMLGSMSLILLSWLMMFHIAKALAHARAR